MTDDLNREADHLSFEGRLLDQLRAARPEIARRRRQHARTRSVAVVVVAGALVAGIVLGQSGSRPPAPRSGIVHVKASTVAYQTKDALAGATGSLVEESTMVNTFGGKFNTIVRWSYDGQQATQFEDASGTELANYVSENGCTFDVTTVNYETQTWWTSPGGNVVFPGSNLDSTNIATIIQDEIAGGGLTIAGQPVVDGQSTIELTGSLASGVTFQLRPGLALSPGCSSGPVTGTVPVSATGGPLQITIWVDPTTYLPVQETLDLLNGNSVTTTFAWLPPTAANLANLDVIVPSGFTETQSGMSAVPAN